MRTKRELQKLNGEFHRKFKKENYDIEKADAIVREQLRLKPLEVRQESINTNKEDNTSSNENVRSRSIIERFNDEINTSEPIRELLSAKNIKFKSELTEEQRGAISILYDTWMYIESIGIPFITLKNVLDQYIDFGVSVGRKGRSEYVEAHKSNLMQQQLQQQSNMMNQGQNNLKI
jgi:hypothetical protein